MTLHSKLRQSVPKVVQFRHRY